MLQHHITAVWKGTIVSPADMRTIFPCSYEDDSFPLFILTNRRLSCILSIHTFLGLQFCLFRHISLYEELYITYREIPEMRHFQNSSVSKTVYSIRISRISGGSKLREGGYNMLDEKDLQAIGALIDTKLDTRLLAMESRMDKRFEAMDERFETMDERFETMDERFEAIDKRFETLESKMDKRFEAIDERFETLEETMDIRFQDMKEYVDESIHKSIHESENMILKQLDLVQESLQTQIDYLKAS